MDLEAAIRDMIGVLSNIAICPARRKNLAKAQLLGGQVIIIIASHRSMDWMAGRNGRAVTGSWIESYTAKGIRVDGFDSYWIVIAR